MVYSLTHPTNGAMELGEMSSERYNRNSGLLNVNIPTTADNIVFDLFGVTIGIVITGVVVESGAGEIAAFIIDVDGWIDGSQTAGTYVSDVLGSRDVYIEGIDVNIDVPGGRAVGYTIRMVEKSG